MHDPGMQPDPIRFFDGAAALGDAVIAAVQPDQFDLPTPCDGWDVRTVINHMIGGSWTFAGRLGGSDGGSAPVRAADDQDVLTAYRDSVRALSAAFARPGALDASYPGPFGRMPGPVVVQLRGAELLVHSWDVARATGQSTDFAPELVAGAGNFFAQAPALPRGEGAPFAAQRVAPAGATDADQLAAFLGRPA